MSFSPLPLMGHEKPELLPLLQDGRAPEDKKTQPLPLCVKGLSVAYHRTPVLFSIDASFQEERLYAIIGPNGAGKSTFLKAVLGLVRPLSGSIEIYGKPLSAMRQRIAYVPQRSSIDWEFPTCVLDVVLMGAYRRYGLWRPIPRALRAQALACLETVGMADFHKRQIGQLSGGQQQRVFLARALLQEADLFLLDEPFAGVDAATERVLIDVLTHIKEAGGCVLCVHHDLTTLRSYFDHVLLVNLRKIIQGPVAHVLTGSYLQETYGGRLPEAYLDQLTG